MLNWHIIPNLLGYTPDFILGTEYITSTGGLLIVTNQGGDCFANGVKIIRPNVIMTNGVVHSIDAVIFFFSCSIHQKKPGRLRAKTPYQIIKIYFALQCTKARN